MKMKYWSSSIAILLLVLSSQSAVQAQDELAILEGLPVEAEALQSQDHTVIVESIPAEPEAERQLAERVAQEVRASLQFQQQIQQFSVTMQSLSRQLESLEKSVNATLSEELPTKAKFHAAAEAFGQAAREHLQALKEASASIAKPNQEALSGLGSLSKLRVEEARGQLARALSLSDTLPFTVDLPLALQAQNEALAIERLMAEKAKLAAKSDELRANISDEVYRVKLAEEKIRAAAMATALKARTSEQKQEQATDNATAQRMEKLESRLLRIEALLERLAGEKSANDQQDDQ